jgi:asparagine synthase (glutamine-hydrolysing)
LSSIFALFALGGDRLRPAACENMGTALSGRREHNQHKAKLWYSSSDYPFVGLGHVAMHFVPEDAFESQPLVDTESGLTLVSSSRLDNRSELGAALSICPEQIRELADSDLILKAFKRWNLDCGNHLLGSFAFIIWDSRDQKLVCIRDHIGCSSLFFYYTSTLFAVSSAPRALFSLTEISRQLDEIRLADYMVWGGQLSTSFYKNVNRLPPAHTLTVSRSTFKINRYWAIDPERRLRLKSDGEYLEAFRTVFEESALSSAVVWIRLRSSRQLLVCLNPISCL